MSDETRDSEALAERIDELESTLEALREELRTPPTGPFGFPRPPQPAEVLRFTDEYAIPAAIAVLEANLRTLELLQRVLRATRRAQSGGDASRRAADLGATSLERIDEALAELSRALEDTDLPEQPEARELLQEARSLNGEIRSRLEPAEDATSPEESPARNDTSDDVDVDVEAELESIKDEVRGDETEDEQDSSEQSASDDESNQAAS